MSLPRFVNDGDGNVVYNNVFYQVKAAIDLGWDGSFGNTFANNIFINNEVGIYLQSGGTATVVTDYLDQYTSHNNLYFNNSYADIHLRPSWAGNFYSGTTHTLSQMQGLYNTEASSLADNPLFLNTNTFEIPENSPAIDKGDGSFWGKASVNIGAYPFSPLADSVFSSGFE